MVNPKRRFGTAALLNEMNEGKVEVKSYADSQSRPPLMVSTSQLSPVVKYDDDCMEIHLSEGENTVVEIWTIDAQSKRIIQRERDREGARDCENDGD